MFLTLVSLIQWNCLWATGAKSVFSPKSHKAALSEMHDSLKLINIWELWWEISCRYDTATCICVADLDLSGQKKLLLGTYGQVRALYNPSVLEKELVSVVLGCKCKTLNYWHVDINIISHDLTRYLKTNIQGAVGLQTEWRTNVGLRVAAKSPSSHSQSLSGLLDISSDSGFALLALGLCLIQLGEGGNVNSGWHDRWWSEGACSCHNSRGSGK